MSELPLKNVLRVGLVKVEYSEIRVSFDLLKLIIRFSHIVVITSAIKGMFSAGADVNELSKSTREEAEHLSTEAKRLFKEIRDLQQPLPVIAAISNYNF
jgi:enoyl-CoA hydratase/carnithine racemase